MFLAHMPRHSAPRRWAKCITIQALLDWSLLYQLLGAKPELTPETNETQEYGFGLRFDDLMFPMMLWNLKPATLIPKRRITFHDRRFRGGDDYVV